MPANDPTTGRLLAAWTDYWHGRLDRRAFLSRATGLGLGLPATVLLANAAGAEDSATPAAGGTESTRPTFGTEGQTRGAGGELKILQWQAASSLSVHAATGGKDISAASLVTEPLVSYALDGTLIPTLAAEVPSLENGGVSADLTTVTYRLQPGILWSDGQPFTADDVVFTWQWIVDPANQSIDATGFAPIAAVEALDPLTVRVTFKAPTLGWYLPFASSYRGSIYPKHFWDGKDQQAANAEFTTAPIGTGPYVVQSFSPNDQIVYAANSNYREPNKPYFATVNLKGGGDATSAARAVLQTGDWDFAENIQVDPAVLAELAKGGKGKIYGTPSTNIEKIQINFSDPNKEVDGQRSQKDTPHPFLTDPAVRQALSLATDRDTIATQLYNAELEPPAKNVLTGIAAFESANTTYTFDIDAAKQTLDAAGWTLDGDVRSKDGVELSLRFVTTINDVRQKTQAVLKRDWEAAGFRVDLVQVDGSIFFDTSPGNEQSFTHFYSDVQMYTDGLTSPFPLLYMSNWYAGPDGKGIAQKANNWGGQNKNRYANPEYDALYDRLGTETDSEAAAGIFVQLNDIVVDEIVEIPLVQRSGETYAATNSLRQENVASNTFEGLYWNIANWNRIEE